VNAQHTPGILGYAIFREGKQTGIERSLPVAKQWVDAEIVPLCAASERDDLLEALQLHHAAASGANIDIKALERMTIAAIAKATGEAA
jgi:hypothetical protein